MEKYLTIQNVFTPTECQQIIAQGKSKSFLQAEMRDLKTGGIIVNENSRKCQWRPIPPSELEFIYHRMCAVAQDAAKQFGLTLENTFDETIKIIDYKPGDHMFHWHYDHGDEPSNYMYYRTLSISICLQEAEQGGEIQIYEGKEIPLKQPAGTALVFPSTLMHNVSQVMKGERISVLGFMHRPKPKNLTVMPPK